MNICLTKTDCFIVLCTIYVAFIQLIILYIHKQRRGCKIALRILLTPFLNTLQLLKAKYAAPILPGQQTYIYVNVPSQYARNFCVSILAFVYFCISVFAQKCHSQACTRPVPDQSVQTNKATMTKIFKPATINIFLLQQPHITSKTNSSVMQLPNIKGLC